MPTPSNRTPLRVARGTYSNLNGSVADIQEGEICYATDQDKLYVKEGGSLVSTQATIDPDTVYTDVAQTFTAPQRGTVTEYTGTSFSIDFSTTNNFVLKPSGNYSVALTGLTGTAGQCGSIFIQPTAAATITGSWPTTMRFVGGSAGITLTGTSASIDRIDYIVLDDTASSEVITCNVTANYVV